MPGRSAAVSAVGVAVPLALWLVLVPWDFEAGGASDSLFVGIVSTLVITAVAAGAVAFISRPAGQWFTPAAFVTILVLFIWRASVSEDAFWPLGLSLLLPAALGALIVGFGLGRLLRAGSPMR